MTQRAVDGKLTRPAAETGRRDASVVERPREESSDIKSVKEMSMLLPFKIATLSNWAQSRIDTPTLLHLFTNC